MEIKRIDAFRPPCDASSETVSVKVLLDRDLSGLLPYINAEADDAKYFPKGSYIKFLYKGRLVMVDGFGVAIAGFSDHESGRGFAKEVVDFLEDIERRKDSITPDHTPFNPPAVMDVFALLPRKAGCGKCGYPACMAFAVALVRKEAEAASCPHLHEAGGSENLSRLSILLGS